MTQSEIDKRIKVCIVTISLAKGGAERSTALLSRMLHDKGFEVHILTLNNQIDYEYSGALFNLGKDKTKKDSLLKRLKRFVKARQFIKNEKFDFIIDNRTRSNASKELFYLNYLYKRCNIIYVVRSFELSEYFPKNTFVAKKMIASCKGVVGVSKAIAEEVNSKFQTNKAVHIYNPIECFEVKNDSINFEKDYILFLGRIVENVKNLSLLLEAYKKSKLSLKKIPLLILGDGPDLKWLKQKVKELHLDEFVKHVSFTPNVYPYLKNAKFLVLTSYYEGFPRVLIEALSVGTPVVSVNCKSGPSEIIDHEENGLLVENFNAIKLSEAFRRYYEDEELYLHCKNNAKQSIEHLHMEMIANQWKTYLENEKY